MLASLAMPSALAQPAGPEPQLPGPPPAVPAAPPAIGPLDAAAPPPGCPDVQVLFARGTTEPPGLGAMGEAFVDDLKARVGPRSVAVYPVDYPASPDFPTALQGVVDASTQVQKIAAACPDTHMVLGGYSQGAAVMGFVTTELIPDGVSASEVPQPMPPDIADHVAAVALLGTPSDRFMNVIQQPAVKIGPLYQPKTIELCVPDDFVCSPGNDIGAHARYISDGLVGQAADFAAGKIAASPKPTSHAG
ncbi:cutinase [Mycolicibacterium psychrotolerans]|uniref:Cutinase n=1 Tax=Mycolicibacterium psychrotolerans TaxID=216929 RepID=A0A7I7M590_9MYCO|nr:cutinase [Mycolicibacterium psychrotolerans]